MGLLFCLATVAAGCGAGTRAPGGPPSSVAAEVGGPAGVRTDPSVPERIAGQQVDHRSSNLVGGDTSFELPVGDYVIGDGAASGAASTTRPSAARGRLVRTLAVHGQHALRLSPLLPGRKCVVHWPAVRLEPDRRYTFSVYARGGGGRMRGELLCGGPIEGGGLAAFRPTGGWQRFHVTFKTPAGDAGPSYRPAVVVSAEAAGGATTPAKEGWVELDAVQLEAGETVTAYLPQRSVECVSRITSVPDAGLIPPGLPLSCESAIRNNTAQRLAVQVVWRFWDVLGAQPQYRAATVQLGAGHAQTLKLDFGAARPGYYILETQARYAHGRQCVDRLGLAVGSRSALARARQSSFVGCGERTEGTSGAGEISRLSPSALGAGSPCCLSWNWRDLETTPGRDDYADAERSVDGLLALGLEPVVCPGRPTVEAAPAWAVRVDGQGAKRVDVRQYRQFVFRVAGRFRQRVRYWLLPSTPVDEEVAWTRVFHDAIRLADPPAKVIGPGFDAAAAASPDRLGAFIAAGGLADVDVLIHGAPCHDKEETASLAQLDDALAGASRQCATAGPEDIPWWAYSPRFSQVAVARLGDRAAALHRTALILKKHAVEHWLVPGSYPMPLDVRANCSVELLALATAAMRIGPARFDRQRQLGPGVEAMLFIARGGAFAALVTTGSPAKDASVSVSVDAGLRVEDVFGRSLSEGTAPVSVTLNSAPVYVIPMVDQDDWLSGVHVLATRPKR
ncbi:MAG: hypothetical protein JXQ73_04105 [Phycisphaerae bacterium]|nr:hypothetical protein [Phycisphaerae bacterium]